MAPVDTVPREAMVHPAEPGYGSSGSYGGYGSSGGYGSYGGGYGSSGGGGQGGFDFGGFGFDFEDLFGGGQRRNYQSTAYTENDPELRSAAQAVLAGGYSEALGRARGHEPKGGVVLLEAPAPIWDWATASQRSTTPAPLSIWPRMSPLSANCLRSSTRAAAPTGNAGHRGLWLLSLCQSLPDAVSGQHAVQLLLSGRAWRLLLLLN